ncbi:MAG TPA: DUF1702 family protein, partial [Pilimelia sp.]|nr:DUF1702 family protein [Pilimelia sp.]
ELAVGAVFAAKARTHAGHVPAHTEVATRAFAELSVVEAVAAADGTAVLAGTPAGAGTPAYEQWRERIRRRVAAAVPANSAAG